MKHLQLIIPLLCATFIVPPAYSQSSGQDQGYVFSSAHVEEERKELTNGLLLIANHQKGVFVSENPDSPWYQATFLAQGTTFQNVDGHTIGDAAILESVDADGDAAWAYIFQIYGVQPYDFHFIGGTGKWEGITGKGVAMHKGMASGRADDHFMPTWKMEWTIKPGGNMVTEIEESKKNYTGYDKGYSFHGPHMNEEILKQKNGLVLISNNQRGVFISENPESPFYDATWLASGTTIKNDEGKTLGDIMLSETIDPEGDVVWIVHTWWYAEGGGLYKIIGGTGKWEGIQGEGKTLGMRGNRTDGHFMLNAEAYWKLQ